MVVKVGQKLPPNNFERLKFMWHIQYLRILVLIIIFDLIACKYISQTMFGNKSQFAFSGSTTRRVFLFIAIASPLLFCLYWVVGVLTESDMFFRSLHNDAIGYSSVRPMDINADLTSELPKESPSNAAYVFLALGPQALQMNCPAAIESLSRIGGWTGDVYLISDRLDCFDKDEIVRNAEMKEDKLHIVSVDDDFSSGGYDFKHKDIGLRQVRVKSFAMKTKLFNYVDENIEKIAYVDCDVLFSIPGCANDFAQSQDNHWKDSPFGFTRVKYGNISADGSASIISDIPEPIHYMPTTFTAPPGNNVLADLHAGSFVAHRHHSKEGLRIWRERLEKLIEVR